MSLIKSSTFIMLLLPFALVADEEYRGKFTPDADYVLSGQLRKDIGPLPEMPYHYLSEMEGYDASALSPVPAPGVHPRVLMSPQDVEQIKAKVALGDQADRYFRIIWNDVQVKAKKGDMLCMALQALATDDDELGRKAAEELVELAKYSEPMIDIFNTHEDMKPVRDSWYYYARSAISKVGDLYYDDAYKQGGAELIAKLAKEKVVFGSDGDKQTGVFFNTPLTNYDYLYRWLTEEERTLVRRVISKLTSDRYTSGMGLPGHMFINNHMSMGEDQLILNLAIEGEEGWDSRLLKEYSIAVRNKISYDVSLGGMLHEKCKGFLPERATVAITRRASNPESGALPLLAHNHLKLMVWGKVMDSANIYFRYNAGRRPLAPKLGGGFDEPRLWSMGLGSGPWMDQFFNWGFLLKHAYPNDPVVDYYYKSRMLEQDFGAAGTDPKEKLPTPRIDYSHRDLMLMMATDGLRDESGKVVDYDVTGLPPEVTSQTNAWVDLARGVAMSRSSWDKDAMFIHYECRSDVLSAGHETPEANDFNLMAHGVEWSARRDWYMDCYFRNMVLIDGYAGVYSPVAGKLMEVADNETATTFISDATDQYNWRKLEKIFQLWHGMFSKSTLGHMDPFKEHAMSLDRDVELPFQGPIREYQEGYVGLDWGNWHGETRGPERFQRWNDVDHVFRTLHMTKGDKPYALVIDDVRKDDQMHQYDWCFKVSPDVTLYKADSSVKNRYLKPGMPDDRTTDLILCLTDTKEERFQRYGLKNERQPKKGDPMLLVRTLWRNSTFAYPQPAFEESYGPKHVIIPAMAVDPEFRVLLFPHRFGDALPLTVWNSDRSKLTITVGENTDVYRFAKTDRERTVFTMERDGATVAAAKAAPQAPELDVPYGYTPDRNVDDAARRIVIAGKDTVHLKQVPAGMVIRYTLDGSEPSEKSTLYKEGIPVKKSCTLKARTFARYWPFSDDNASETLVLNVVRENPSAVQSVEKVKAGLKAEVFEIRRTIFEGKNGIFSGSKNMMPELDQYQPLLSCLTRGVKVPKVSPEAPAVEMKNAYYRFRGFFQALEDGVYGFKLNSCGPVQLKVAGQDLINVTGPYGHSQKDRFGEVVLSKGLHAFEVVVCDPVFWKGDREEAYVVDLAVMQPGAKTYEACPDAFVHIPQKGFDFQPLEKVFRSKGVKVKDTVPGLVMKSYDRTSRTRKIPPNRLPLDHFAIGKNEQPYAQKPVLGIEPSDNAAKLLEFSGWLIADKAGVYEFKADLKGGNQLFIAGNEILHNSVIAPKLPGRIELKKGLHPFSFRLAESGAECLVKLPGRKTFIPVNAGMFVRKAEVTSFDDGRLVVSYDGESVPGGLRNGELVDGKYGKGMRMKGKESQLLIEDVASPEDACTLMFWLKLDKKVDTKILNSSWATHPYARLRGYNLQGSFFRGSEEAIGDLRPFGAEKGEWVHVAVTWDDQKVTVFGNGELLAWKPKTEGVRSAHIEDIVLFDGLDAVVDEVKVFNKALDAEQVKAAMAK